MMITGIGMPISQASAPFMGWSFPLRYWANAAGKRTVPDAGTPRAGAPFAREPEAAP